MTKFQNAMWCVLMILLVAGCAHELPRAIDRELKWRYEMRLARCQANYMPGYCGDFEVSEARQ